MVCLLSASSSVGRLRSLNRKTKSDEEDVLGRETKEVAVYIIDKRLQ